MTRDDLGFVSSPVNGLGIVRARTLLGNLRLWDIPRLERALELTIKEIGHSPIPGLYVLLDERSEKKAYIGQSENIEVRLLSHMRSPDAKIKNWQRALFFNDGRNASQSDLNDENIRLTLENYLVNLFKINRYQTTTVATRLPSLSSHQFLLVHAFQEEINIPLTNKGKITRILQGRRDDEVYSDEVKKSLTQHGYRLTHWGEKYGEVNGEPVIIRPGSQKPKGWQVTFRGSQSLARLKGRVGYLLMPRGSLLLVPLKEIADFVYKLDNQALSRDTIDIFICFDDDKVVLVYKGGEMDITRFSVTPYLATRP
jgi:hypothetical protein